MAVTDATQQAALQTRAQVRDTLRQTSGGGTQFAHLLRVAERESRFQAGAKASNSSATGVFQFTEQTWLHMIKNYGGKYGLANQAAAIRVQPGGRQDVSDPAMRRAILAGRSNPKLATQMATELANENRGYLEKRLGRTVTDGEVYAAHAFGAHGALKLIQARAATPGKAADAVLPAAAHANRALFYDPATHAPRSVAQLLGRFEAAVAGPRRLAGLLSDDSATALTQLAA